MPYSLEKHLDYNCWAADRLVQTLEPAEEAILFEERKSSFASIAKTIRHMWDAETIWRIRMEGVSMSEWPSKNFIGGKKELLAEYAASAVKLREFILSKGPQFLDTKFSYRNLKGELFEDVIEEVLFHVVNHGSYHRGQVITMLREAGITTIQSMDLVHYLRTIKQI